MSTCSRKCFFFWVMLFSHHFFSIKGAVAISTPAQRVLEADKRVICFHNHNGNERGVDVSIFDYGHYAESILGHTVKIVMLDTPEVRNGVGTQKLIARFGDNVVFYPPDEKERGTNIPTYAKKHGCEFILMEKYGTKDSYPSFPDAFNDSLVPTGVHSVFVWEQHDIKTVTYAGISATVARKDPKNAFVPLIVRPPSPEYPTLQDMRAELNIPKSALVFCRHGGMDTFNVHFQPKVIYEQLDKTPDKNKLMFLFLGTKPFYDHKEIRNQNRPAHHNQIIFLPTNTSFVQKERFIKSCDVMLHGRIDGETFGLAISDFSVRNKPVITFPGQYHEHLDILGDKAFIYRNANEMAQHIEHFLTHGVDTTKDWNAYRNFLPHIVIRIFEKIFLDPVFNHTPRNPLLV